MRTAKLDEMPLADHDGDEHWFSIAPFAVSRWERDHLA
jgi:hypothetical protein